MPKVLENRERMKALILKLLSTNARMSINDLATELKTSKATAYNLFQEVVKEYDLHFIPEVNVEELWRYEFVRLARTHSKREILEDIVDKLPQIGFEEYIVLFKFVGKMPKDDEIMKAIGDSYLPQFVGRLHGDYDYIMYAVARGYLDIDTLAINMSKKLKKYKMLFYISRTYIGFGYFPLSQALIKQMALFDTYQSLLLGLNEDGRATLSDIGKVSKRKTGASKMLYAYDRLKRTEILRRVTYYEGKPKNVVVAAILVKISDYNTYMQSKPKWFINMTRESEKKHNPYVLACDISVPNGLLIISCFENGNELEAFVTRLKGIIKGGEVDYMELTETLLGNLGIRDFDMRYSLQYQTLERLKLVPRFYPKAVENVEALEEAEPMPEELS